ncbi:MAG: NAD(P)-dependent oxidoreductase [Carnobacterium sp.]
MAHILITGATGTIGQTLTNHLKKEHHLTLVDIHFDNIDQQLLEDVIVKKLDLTLEESWKGLLDGIEYILHLAGEPSPDAKFYKSLLDLNYKIPHNLFHQATQKNSSVKRIIFASSIHVVDAYPANVQVHIEQPIRPSDLYGVSKAYVEALASYYAFTKNQEAIGIRIGNFKESGKPNKQSPPYDLADFISARDLCHLIDCTLIAELKEPFLLVNGISNNTFPRLDIDQARVTIGYHPQDNAFE